MACGHLQDNFDLSSLLGMIISFNDAEVEALALLPPLIQQYVTDNFKLNSSGIQILNFVDNATLLEARDILKQKAIDLGGEETEEANHGCHTSAFSPLL